MSSNYSVIILCKTLLKGGAEKQALILSKLLTENKVNITLIAWCADKIDPSNHNFIVVNSIKHIGLCGNPISKLLRLFEIIKAENTNILLSYLSLANLVAGIVKLFKGRVITIGGIRDEKLPYHKFVFEKFIHNFINDATVCNSFSAKKIFVKQGFNPDKMLVIQNAIHVPPLKKNNIPRDEIIVISVSRFIKLKDHKTALFSFKKVLEKTHSEKLRYYFIGYGPMEPDIRMLVNRLNLRNEVKILINPPNIAEILRSCDIYLSTSLNEGLSNSIMEAMVAGLPIIATDVGDNRFLIQDSYNGFIVPPRDISLIAKKLEILISSEKTRHEFGVNSHQIMKSKFKEEKLLENYVDLFSKFSEPAEVQN